MGRIMDESCGLAWEVQSGIRFTHQTMYELSKSESVSEQLHPQKIGAKAVRQACAPFLGNAMPTSQRVGPIDSGYSTNSAISVQAIHARDCFFGSSLMPSFRFGTGV